MAKTVSLSEVRSLVRGHLRKRRDLGLGKLIVDLMLEPRDPFEPKKRRLARKAFVLIASSLLALAGVFACFNLLF